MKMKKLLLSCGLVAFSGAMLATSTFAWFSMNKEVTVTGLKVQASTAGSLVIHDTDEMLKITTITKASGDNNVATVLAPSTLRLADNVDDAAAATATPITTDLMRVYNSTDVDPATGYAKEGKDLQYTKVDNSGEVKYYKDYEFYVAASGDVIKNHKLVITAENVKFTNELKIEANDEDTKKKIESDITRAFSVIVYAVNSETPVAKEAVTTKDHRIGVLDLAKFVDNNPADDVLPTVEWEASELGTIREAAASGNIHFVFRVYLDGAKEQGETGKAWVRNVNSITANDVTFDLKITAVDTAV